MNLEKRLSAIEAVLFVTGEEGVSMDQLIEILGQTEIVVTEALSLFKETLTGENRGLELVEVAGRYKLVTKKDLFDVIKRLVENPKPSSLTQASLETLAIIAYKQPVSRVDIEEVRGVKSEKAIQTLVGRGLIKEMGRVEGTGRAILYGVTDLFLDHFGLKSLEELPEIKTDFQDSEEETRLFYENMQQTLFD